MASEVMSSVQMPASSSECIHSPAPRVLKRELEDQLRGQGVRQPDIRSLYPDSWIGKCSECKKYADGICWADKQHPYNPVSPGKDGVCTLRYPGGQFKARRSRR